MPLPTQDNIDGAVDTWFDDNFSDGAIVQETGALVQLFNAKQALKDGIFASIDDESEASASNTYVTTGNFSDGDTVSIGLLAGGVKVYTAKSTLDNVDGHFHVGANEAASHANLEHAINGTGGTPGTDYAAATTAHPDVTAADDGSR